MKARFVVIGVLVVSSVALAKLELGTTVYVKARNTRLFQKADPLSASLMTLQPGAPLKWQEGPVNKEFHLVTAGERKGYVYFTSLTLKQPEPEYLQSKGNTPIPPAAFASSGAATKALGEGAVEYGNKKLNKPDAVKAVLAMEAMAEQTSDRTVAEYIRSVGLVPAVGSSGR